MTTTFDLQVDDIIRQAYLRLGGEPTTGQNARDARTALNLLFIDLINRGAPLAKVSYRTLTLVAGQETYTLDQDTVDLLDATIKFGNSEYGINRRSMSEYLHIPNKEEDGKPSQYSITREKDEVTVTFWPVPDDTQPYDFNYYSIIRFDDISSSRQNADINFRYLPSIVSGLSYYLSLQMVDFDPGHRAELKLTYEEELERAKIEDTERVPHTVTPFAYTGF